MLNYGKSLKGDAIGEIIQALDDDVERVARFSRVRDWWQCRRLKRHVPTAKRKIDFPFLNL